MALEEIEIEPKQEGVPAKVAEFSAEAQRRIDDFVNRRRDDPVPGFVPCGFEEVFGALETVARERLAPGLHFCEWGAGFGVAACLASMLGFEASGIEIEDELVEEANSLAEDFDIEAEFVAGNFVPVEGEDLADTLAESAWLVQGGRDGHDELGLDPEDFDIVFAFPWPGEETVIMKIFDRMGASGSLLLLYLGLEGIKLFRKK
jgi:hypothetical protein